jgi:glycosyltransferase involved in cell wall biosynthesis
MRQSISAVVPVFNAELTIDRCLKSILFQTMKPSEIICIIDGATDGSEAIIAMVASQADLPIKILIQANSGPAIARNLAVKTSNCDLLAFLDSDDYWHPSHLEVCVEALVSHEADLVGSSGSSFFKQAGVVSRCKALFSNPFITSSVLMKRAIFLQTSGFPDRRYSEDYGLWLDLIFSSFRAVVIKNETVVYSKFNPTSLSSNLLKMQLGELRNYLFLRSKFSVSFAIILPFMVISLLKFTFRVAMTFTRLRFSIWRT